MAVVLSGLGVVVSERRRYVAAEARRTPLPTEGGLPNVHCGMQLLGVLALRYSNDRHKPVIDVLRLVERHKDSSTTHLPLGETIPLEGIVRKDWTADPSRPAPSKRSARAAPEDAEHLADGQAGQYAQRSPARVPRLRAHPSRGRGGAPTRGWDGKPPAISQAPVGTLSELIDHRGRWAVSPRRWGEMAARSDDEVLTGLVQGHPGGRIPRDSGVRSTCVRCASRLPRSYVRALFGCDACRSPAVLRDTPRPRSGTHRVRADQRPPVIPPPETIGFIFNIEIALSRNSSVY